MSNKKISYPQYRKYNNGKSFFKIFSPTRFDEIQIFGNKITIHHFEAKILPDRNYIYDLTYNFKENWELCEAKEYNKILNLIGN